MQNILEKLGINRKSFTVIFICLSIVVYFIIYSIFGNRGILDYFHLKQQLEEKSLESKQLSTQIQNKENRVKRMQDNSLDLDLLDEEVRKNIGQAKKNEIIIYDTNSQL